MTAPTERLDLAALGNLAFESPDAGRFPALRLAREALRTGGAAPTVLNAANEVAVEGFLAGKIGFLEIAGSVEHILERFPSENAETLDTVLAVDAEARRLTRELIGSGLR